MIRPIVKWPSPTLKKVSMPVPDPANIKELIQDMKDTMNANDGLGLSAIQIGVPLEVIVTIFPDCPIIINPKITLRGVEQENFVEGCLSLPGLFEKIRRPKLIEIEYMDETAWPSKKFLEGVAAQCIQHEMEHLSGKFFLDHVTSGRRDQIRSLMRKGKL